MKKINIKKLAVSALCWIFTIIFLTTEAYLAVQHEATRQRSVANNIYDDIILDLNMTKVAIQTIDIDLYSEKISHAQTSLESLQSLSFVRQENAEYISSIDSYLRLLESKKDLLKEITIIRSDIDHLSTTLKTSYGDKSTITRDSLKLSPDSISKLKLDQTKFTFDSVKQTAASINGALDNFAGKATELVNCIDTCYKDAIKKINDSLSENFKSFADGAAAFNDTIEKEFSIQIIDEIKSNKPEIANENSFSRNQ